MSSASTRHAARRTGGSLSAPLGTGRIDAGGVTKDVMFELANAAVRDDLDDALHRKYDRYGRQAVGAITGDDVQQTTLRVMPRD